MRSRPEIATDAGRSTAAPLTLAGIAALLASTCCVAPLVFVFVGISGAWIAQLRVLEPYSNALTVVAALSLAWAGWRMHRRARVDNAACDGEACRTGGSAARRWFWVLVLLTVLPLAVQWAAPWFY